MWFLSESIDRHHNSEISIDNIIFLSSPKSNTNAMRVCHLFYWVVVRLWNRIYLVISNICLCIHKSLYRSTRFDWFSNMVLKHAQTAVLKSSFCDLLVLTKCQIVDSKRICLCWIYSRIFQLSRADVLIIFVVFIYFVWNIYASQV